MVKFNKKFAISILILFFLISLLSLLLNSESNGLIYGVISYLFLFDKTKITKYDYIFAGSLVLGTILKFIDIFTKNIYPYNLCSVFICGLSIFIYLKKSGTDYE